MRSCLFKTRNIINEKYGIPGFVKAERYFSDKCRDAPPLTTHYFWKDSNGTIIQLDSTYASIGDYKSCNHYGRITVMSKKFIDNIQAEIDKRIEKDKQDKERDIKIAVDNL
jgi:hypothetical protein